MSDLTLSHITSCFAPLQSFPLRPDPLSRYLSPNSSSLHFHLTQVLLDMPTSPETQRAPKWHIPSPLYSLPSTRHFTTGPAVDENYKGAWSGFHVIEELAPHPPGFRYVALPRSAEVGNGAQQLTYPSRVGTKPAPPQCSSEKDSSPVPVASRRRYAVDDILRLGGEPDYFLPCIQGSLRGYRGSPKEIS